MSNNRCRALLVSVLLAVTSCASPFHKLTITLGKTPVYIEPTAQVASGVPPAEMITAKAFGVDNYIEYHRGDFRYTTADQVANLKDLGLGFHRVAGGKSPSWGRVQPQKEAGYDFTRLDQIYSALVRLAWN